MSFWDEKKVEGAFITASDLQDQALEKDLERFRLEEQRSIKYAELLGSAEGSVEMRKASALAGVAELDTKISICEAVSRHLRKQAELKSAYVSAWQTHARLTT